MVSITNDTSTVETYTDPKFGTIRALSDEQGEPWFIAKDVCDILGIATNHLREEGRGLDSDEVASLPNWEGKGSAPLIINEPGLYKLIMRSRKPEAKAFQRWVEQGLFRIKETAITHADGHVTINRTTKVTGRGQTYFLRRYAGIAKQASVEARDEAR